MAAILSYPLWGILSKTLLDTYELHVSLSFSIEQQTAYTPVVSQARVPRYHYRA
jgi:hypothetical protein